MSTRLVALCFDADDPLRLARFWAAAMVDCLIALGDRRVDIGQSRHDHHVVPADPEGNAFCVLTPR